MVADSQSGQRREKRSARQNRILVYTDEWCEEMAGYFVLEDAELIARHQTNWHTTDLLRLPSGLLVFHRWYHSELDRQNNAAWITDADEAADWMTRHGIAVPTDLCEHGRLPNLARTIDALGGDQRAIEPAGGPARQSAPSQCIVFVKEGVYRVAGEAIRVTEKEDCVLQAFLESPPMSGRELVDSSGIEDAVKVLKNLRDKYDGRFRDAITTPGKKRAGGYRVLVRRAEAGAERSPY